MIGPFCFGRFYLFYRMVIVCGLRMRVQTTEFGQLKRFLDGIEEGGFFDEGENDSDSDTEIIGWEEWQMVERRQRSLVVRGRLMILESVAAKWKALLMEDLCLSAEETRTVIDVQGLNENKGKSWERLWDTRLRELRDYLWWERAIYNKQYVCIDGERYRVGDRWTTRCTDVVQSLMLFPVDWDGMDDG